MAILDTEFDDIRPFSDEEAVAGLSRVAHHPMIYAVSKYFFPREAPDTLSNMLKQIKSVEDFQKAIMCMAIDWVKDNSVSSFTYDGIENVASVKGKYLIMSNHRDIVMDPAFLQYILIENNLPVTEVAVGDNLLASKTVEILLRSNRMIKVIRGISAKELYLSSKKLSKYIRSSITSGSSSVWIAQRQGRTKDGNDTTEQGLLKMFDLSGEKSFIENFKELNIVPMSISYEYEPCDFRKAREKLISRTEKYVKKKNEDMHSILTGIRQQKGDIHIHFGKPLTSQELEIASLCDKNDRYQAIRKIFDRRIIEGYRLWKTNYIAYDLVYDTDKYSSEYTSEDLKSFICYVDHKLSKAENKLDKDALKDIFLRIYSNPVLNKMNLNLI